MQDLDVLLIAAVNQIIIRKNIIKGDFSYKIGFEKLVIFK
jgi:hypothetical protein